MKYTVIGLCVLAITMFVLSVIEHRAGLNPVVYVGTSIAGTIYLATAFICKAIKESKQ